MEQTRYKNIKFERDIFTYTSIALAAIISNFFGGITRGIAIGIAANIISNLPGSQYGELKTLYFIEEIYGHKTLHSIYRMNRLNFYFDSNYTDYGTTQVLYSWWG